VIAKRTRHQCSSSFYEEVYSGQATLEPVFDLLCIALVLPDREVK
jgi:hypothetical protein